MTINPQLSFPLRGNWIALKPPGHHPFAIDFMKPCSKGKRFHKSNFLKYLLNGINVSQYYGWKEPIFSPVNGTIELVSDGYPDNEKTSLISTIWIWFRATYLFKPDLTAKVIDIQPNAGNYIMIKSESGEIAFMAHMRSNSILVEKGDIVKIGDKLGEIGNSGNTTAPHLHLNIFDQAEILLKSKVLEFVFPQYEYCKNGNWVETTNDFPLKKQLIHF